MNDTGQAPKPDMRDLLAAERTFLAWIRTGLALMGFGFVVARFGLFLQQLEIVQHTPAAPKYGLSLWFGTALIGAGVVVLLLSAWHHLRLVRELERGGPMPARPSIQAVLIAVFLALVGVGMAGYLMFVHGSGAGANRGHQQESSVYALPGKSGMVELAQGGPVTYGEPARWPRSTASSCVGSIG